MEISEAMTDINATAGRSDIKSHSHLSLGQWLGCFSRFYGQIHWPNWFLHSCILCLENPFKKKMQTKKDHVRGYPVELHGTLRMLGMNIIKHTRYKSEQLALSKTASEWVTVQNNYHRNNYQPKSRTQGTSKWRWPYISQSNTSQSVFSASFKVITWWCWLQILMTVQDCPGTSPYMGL